MNHQEFLTIALLEAEKGRGFCAPNPAVGAVIVKDNHVLAVGHHQGPGKPHAEVEAIAKLNSAQCENAEIYITLEPCCHFGRTPPCTDLLIQKKFKAVCYGFQDPNPIVAGKGAEKILAAGIDCQYIKVPAITEFYRSYAYWNSTKKPFITAKIALSLDGKIGRVGATPIKLTGQVADQWTHQQRKLSDAILSTVKTVIADDPRLDARTTDGTYQKKLFLVDSKNALPSNAKIFTMAKSITIFTGKRHPREGGDPGYNAETKIDYIDITQENNCLDLAEIISYLGKQGLHDVWVEAGATLLNNLLEQQLVNRLIVYLCPKLLGEAALNGFIKEHQLPEPRWQIMGNDVMAEFIF